MSSPPMLLRCLPFVLAILACPHVTHAADPDAGVKEKAKNLFEAGLRAAERGDCVTALPLFQESLATYRFDTLGALYNTAQCESELGQTGAAFLHFREFLREVKVHSDQIGPATDAIAGMTKAGPWIKFINLDKLPADATTLLDGVSLGPLRTITEIPVKVGDHEVVIRVPSQPDRRLSTYVHEGERRDVDVRPKEQPNEPPSAPPPFRRVGFVVGGVGLGSLLAGVTTGIVAIKQNEALLQDCGGNANSCKLWPDTLEARVEEGKTLTNAANATFIIGGLLTAVGTTFVLLPASKSKEVALSPLFFPGGGGLSVNARF